MNITFEQKRKLLEEKKIKERNDRFKFDVSFSNYISSISLKPRKKFKRRTK